MCEGGTEVGGILHVWVVPHHLSRYRRVKCAVDHEDVVGFLDAIDISDLNAEQQQRNWFGL